MSINSPFLSSRRLTLIPPHPLPSPPQAVDTRGSSHLTPSPPQAVDTRGDLLCHFILCRHVHHDRVSTTVQKQAITQDVALRDDISWYYCRDGSDLYDVWGYSWISDCSRCARTFHLGCMRSQVERGQGQNTRNIRVFISG